MVGLIKPVKADDWAWERRATRGFNLPREAVQGAMDQPQGFASGSANARPASPVPALVSQPGGVAQIIESAASRFGVSYGWLLRVANCESHLNPMARNPSGASGLFQFMPQTFAHYAAIAGHSGASIWDARAQADTAAYMFSIGQSGQWSCR